MKLGAHMGMMGLFPGGVGGSGGAYWKEEIERGARQGHSWWKAHNRSTFGSEFASACGSGLPLAQDTSTCRRFSELSVDHALVVDLRIGRWAVLCNEKMGEESLFGARAGAGAPSVGLSSCVDVGEVSPQVSPRPRPQVPGRVGEGDQAAGAVEEEDGGRQMATAASAVALAVEKGRMGRMRPKSRRSSGGSGNGSRK